MRKTIFLAALAAVASATTLVAQNTPPRAGRGIAGGRGPGGPGAMGERFLLKDITLTDAQKAKLDEMRSAEREKMQGEGGRGRGDGDFAAIREARAKGDSATVARLIAEQRSKIDAQRDARIAAIRGILSSDQLAQFDANVADLKKRDSEMGPGRGGRGRRGGPPSRP